MNPVPFSRSNIWLLKKKKKKLSEQTRYFLLLCVKVLDIRQK